MLATQHLVKQYGELTAVDDVSFEALTLVLATLIVAYLAVRRFEYQ